ncbi:MAG: UDP-N-acetylglucosamine pyrophosphorylase [Oscillospiraceae bacterium]|jgi:UDP-N-acetylglucosamine diphosphorylase / glucose-1-phosphate thymidylyltransferase / UDP-N-acetylgalactosamine diphosphorylase / glucosamine-1-phosphate N-acetyltransferase / galactosamine-1-phosphate N-acetyltransferase
MFEPVQISSLFDLSHTAAAPLLRTLSYPWEALPKIGELILQIGQNLSADEYECRGENVWVHRSAVVFESAYLHGPAIIGPNTEVRQCAFIRGKALVGAGCVVGNSTELKNVILFDSVQVPHYNYVGDSILGYKAHMGAGSITSNIKSDKTNVSIRTGSERIETGLRKMGAMIGDYVEIGCNSVLNPGTVVGRETTIYPLSMVRGYIPPHSIYKCAGEIAQRQ